MDTLIVAACHGNNEISFVNSKSTELTSLENCEMKSTTETFLRLASMGDFMSLFPTGDKNETASFNAQFHFNVS